MTPNIANKEGIILLASPYHPNLGKDIICDVVECVVAPGAGSSFAATTLGEQQGIEQQLCLLEIFGYVHVVMHPEYLWLLAGWKGLAHGKVREGVVTQLAGHCGTCRN